MGNKYKQGCVVVVQDKDEKEVSNVHDQAKDLESRLLELGRQEGNQGSDTINGHRGVNISHGREGFSDRKKREKEKADTRLALKQATQILENQLAALNRQLAQVDKVLGAFDKLEDLIKNGKFDKDNIDHMALLQMTGMTLEEMQSPDALKIHSEKKNPYVERREKLLEKGRSLVEELDEQGGGSSPAVKEFKQQLRKEDGALSYEIVANVEAPEEVKKAVAEVRTEGHIQKNASFASFASSLGDLGGGIITENASIKQEFEKVSNPTPPSEVQVAATNIPTSEGPKI